MFLGTPWDSIPILKVGDEVIGQSLALSRYAATKARLVGSNDEEDAQIDAIVDACDELRRKPWSLFFSMKDEAKKVT